MFRFDPVMHAWSEMKVQWYILAAGLLFTVLLALGTGIVLAEAPNDSVNLTWHVGTASLPDQEPYNITVVKEVLPGFSGPVMKIANSTPSGQDLYTVPVRPEDLPGDNKPSLAGANSPTREIHPPPDPPDLPPDAGEKNPVSVTGIPSDYSSGFSLSAASFSVGPGDSLQAAIDAVPDGSTVYLDPGTYYEHSITISKNITLRANASAGGSRDTTIIDAEQAGGIFSLSGAYSLAIDNLTLRNATGSLYGGAISAQSGGVLAISSTSFTNCTAIYSGGAIRLYYGLLNITDSSFTNCSVTGNSGGTIYTYQSTVEITASTFSNCSAGAYGGAIYDRLGSVNATSSTFVNCSAAYTGGAIYADTSTLDIDTSMFTNCSAMYDGGAVSTRNCSSRITSSSFSMCTATYDGGAIEFSYGTLTLISTTFSHCSTSWNGGSISTYSGTVSINSSSFSDSSARYAGGAIYTMYGNVTIALSTFSDNSVITYDGGAVAISSGNLTIDTSTFSRCSAAESGGAIWNGGSTIALISSTFADCSAGSYGGAIYSVFGNTGVTSSAFSRCSAFLGGAVLSYYGTASIDSSTFENCASVNGGAINNNDSGILTVTNTSFSHCSANTGGAIMNYGNATIGNHSIFTGCSAVGAGAIYNGGSSLIIASTAFSDCQADYVGGGVESYTTLTIISSSFTNCHAIYEGGAIFNPGGGTINIFSTVFSDCHTTGFSPSSGPGRGGAISNAGTLTIDDASLFTRCWSEFGGAIMNYGTLTIEGSSLFDGCVAYYGGAICTAGTSTILSSTFTRCSAISGAAIYALTGTMTATSSTFTSCTVTQFGGAIYDGNCNAVIRFSRFYQNTAPWGGPAIYNIYAGTVDATNNWWGSNSNPSGQVSGTVISNPWLTLGITADPAALSTSEQSAIRTNLTFDSAGTDTSGGGIFVPANITNTYAVTAGIGSVLPITNGTRDGTAQTTFTPAYAGTTTISGRVDDQTVYITLPVSQGTPVLSGITPWYGVNSSSVAITNLAGISFMNTGRTVVTLMRAGHANITATGVTVVENTRITCTFPITGAEAGRWDVVVTNPDGQEGILAGGFTVTVPFTGAATFPPYESDDIGDGSASATIPLTTVTVNIGGNSKVWQAMVTGTKLSELIVTGTVQPGPGSNQTAPAGTVYQYINLVPARYTSITKSVISFTVPQSWLDDNHIAPGSVVLYHQTANGWEALPTTVLSTKDGTVYFSAQSTTFSLFAIAGTPEKTVPVALTETPAALIGFRQEQEPMQAVVTKAPVTTQTTAPPASAGAPTSSSPFPVIPALISMGCVGLIGGGWYLRRWYIRRQNPALFREYD